MWRLHGRSLPQLVAVKRAVDHKPQGLRMYSDFTSKWLCAIDEFVSPPLQFDPSCSALLAERLDYRLYRTIYKCEPALQLPRYVFILRLKSKEK